MSSGGHPSTPPHAPRVPVGPAPLIGSPGQRDGFGPTLLRSSPFGYLRGGLVRAPESTLCAAQSAGPKTRRPDASVPSVGRPSPRYAQAAVSRTSPPQSSVAAAESPLGNGLLQLRQPHPLHLASKPPNAVSSRSCSAISSARRRCRRTSTPRICARSSPHITGPSPGWSPSSTASLEGTWATACWFISATRKHMRTTPNGRYGLG